MNSEDKRIAQLRYRVIQLPKQLDRARRRVRQLENEARSLGFYDLLGEEK